ncbi:hypothetical protein V496_06154 [Pseudogymnoascus sp. VKM F-4515 (FW-2607)]|nr:hypothetical protein V496_06154 [Pseudogymnoascus sp. VKM F-4515 (FW-2607)]
MQFTISAPETGLINPPSTVLPWTPQPPNTGATDPLSFSSRDSDANPRRRSTTNMPQGLSQLMRNVARHTPSAKDVAHARTLRVHCPFGRGGAECKGLSDYREASNLWDTGANGPLSGILGGFWAIDNCGVRRGFAICGRVAAGATTLVAQSGVTEKHQDLGKAPQQRYPFPRIQNPHLSLYTGQNGSDLEIRRPKGNIHTLALSSAEHKRHAQPDRPGGCRPNAWHAIAARTTFLNGTGALHHTSPSTENARYPSS